MGYSKGGKTMRGGGSFSMDELQMLRDLPAVANVSKDRITYSNAFKQVCHTVSCGGIADQNLPRGGIAAGTDWV